MQKFEDRIRSLSELSGIQLRVATVDGMGVRVSFFGEQRGEKASYSWVRRKRWMAGIRRIARMRGVDVEFDFSDLRDSLTALERIVFEDVAAQAQVPVEGLTIEFTKIGGVRTIVDLGDRQVSSAERKGTDELVRSILRVHKVIRVEKVILLDAGASEATDPQVVRVLRVFGPCSKDDLQRLLESRDYRVPSTLWLNRTLDRLRQHGHIRYVGEDKFALTPKTLLSTPSPMGRSSVDVQRALAMARRKVW